MIKQVIVVRTQYPHPTQPFFKPRAGKLIAQACHASMAFLTKRLQKYWDELDNMPASEEPPIFDFSFQEAEEWIRGIFTKVCLRVDSEEELLELEKKAQEAGLEVQLITDRGITEFHGVPTHTCLAIGPAEADKIDEITGDLKLY